VELEEQGVVEQLEILQIEDLEIQELRTLEVVVDQLQTFLQQADLEDLVL
jgi:hypothetical protein